MAFTTGTTYTYTDRMFKRGTIGLNLPATLAPSYNWFNGVDVTSSQYLIYSDTYTTGIASQANSRPTAWTTPDKTDASLLGLINTLPERVGQTSFTATTSALSWLQSTNRYFLINNGYENIVTSGLTLSWDAGWYNSYKTGNTLWYDISGSYVNGTFTNGPSFSSDSGGTISFDGTDDYVSASVSSPGPPITVETICKFNESASDSSNYRYVFSLGNDSTGTMISLAKATSQSPSSPLLPNQGYCYIGNNNPRPINYIFTGSAYHHVVLQVLSDNTTIKCYIDGVEVSVSNDSTTISLSSTLNVGRYVGSNWYLNGNIQTFRIYNRVLSQAEILKNYNTQKGRIGYDNIISSGLKLNLNSQIQLSYSGGGNSWYDLSGNNNTGTLTNGPTFDSTTRSIVFDGTDDKVPINYTTNFDSWTLEALLQPNGLQSPGAGIIFFRGTNANGMNFIYNQTGLKVTFHWKDLGSTFAWAGGPTLVDNTWTHLLMTVNPTIAKFYVNGVLNSSLPGTYANTGTVGDLNIGLDNCCGSRFFKGKIAKSAIYNRELSTTEVLQNYYQGNVVTSGLVLALDAGNLVSYGGIGTSWKDLTNTKSGATLINGTSYTFLNNGALIFDGTDDYATVASSSDWAFGANGTVSMWAYFTGTLTANHRFWCTNNLETYLDAYLDGTTGYVGLHGSSTSTTTLFPRDQWVNLTVTYIGGVIAVYYNGVPQPLQGKTTGYNISNTGTLFIGQYAGGGGYTWRGRMSTMFTYNRGLSAMEVQQNFNAHRGRYGL
jgi:hypothetical protein